MYNAVKKNVFSISFLVCSAFVFTQSAFTSYNYQQDEIKREFYKMREQGRNLDTNNQPGQGIPKSVDKIFAQLDDPRAEARAKAHLQRMKK